MKKIVFLFSFISMVFVCRAQNASSETIKNDVSTPKTILRRGLESTGEVEFLRYGEHNDVAIGANIILNYRFAPVFAFGLGYGCYDSFNHNEEWNLLLANAVFNFTKDKLSPFAAVEAGLGGYYDRYCSRNKIEYTPVAVYLGLNFGVRYSINKNFALKANIKTGRIGLYVGNFVGLGLGVVYLIK